MSGFQKILFGAPGVDQLLGKKASRLLRDPLNVFPKAPSTRAKLGEFPDPDRSAAIERERLRRASGRTETRLTPKLGLAAGSASILAPRATGR